MEDQRRSNSSSNSDYHNDTVNDDTTQPKEQPESTTESSSYYYAYGPRNTSADRTTTTALDMDGNQTDVPMTHPSPVKPMPFSSATRQNYAGFGGRGDGGSDGKQPPAGGNWQYSQRPEKKRSTFRTGFISFLAGALVVSGLMFTADYTNLFTGGEAADSTGGSSGNAQTVSDTSVKTPFPNGTTSVSDVVKSASPAVVKIETFGTASTGTGNSWMDDPLFKQFFGGTYGDSGQGEEKSAKELQPLGIGTGFIFDKTGYILTNNHVIDGGEMVQVTVEGHEKPYTAKVLGTSAELDLAVLKIEGTDFPTVNLGDSDQTDVGEQVVAIGNPSGFDHTVTSGWLSARGRSIDVNDNGVAKTYSNLLQTDAAINPGNSGGPLLNMKGDVIGMNVAVSRDSQGIGFAIPSNVINGVLDHLKANEEIPKEPAPFIGATLMTMTEDVATQLGIPNIEGALVYNVVFGSPAYESEIRAYDVITSVDGTAVKTKEELIKYVQSKKVGDKIKLSVTRNGKTSEVGLTIGDKNKFKIVE